MPGTEKNPQEIEIQWPDLGVGVRATLEKEAQRLCDLLWSQLPIESIMVHGVISGQIIYSWSPIPPIFIKENQKLMSELAPGDMYIGPFTQNIGIVYGKVSEPMPTNHFAKIRKEDIPKLSEIGIRIWQNMLQPYAAASEPEFKERRKQLMRVVYRKVSG